MKLTNMEKILGVFFDKPAYRYYVREIARITDLNPNTVLNIISQLEKEELVIREKKSYIVEVFANFSEKFKEKKRIFNLKKIYESGIISFLKKKFSPTLISVIGSYSMGEDSEKSDIDFVIISNIKNDLDLSLFEKFIGRNIHLIVADYKDFSGEFYINLINGVVLYGYLEKK